MPAGVARASTTWRGSRGGDVAAVGSSREGAPPIATWNTYIAVESADATAAKVRDAGGSVAMEPFDIMGAGRMAVFADPEGAVFCVWQAGEHKGARIVNEHGSVNFNGLETRDVEGAKAFYGAVFGWTTLALGGGAEMWTLPGYGDHLESSAGPPRADRRSRRPAGLRGRGREPQPDRGRPTGRAGRTGASRSGSTTPARSPSAPRSWAGRFWSSRSTLPWSRITVISDPQGATFIASQFVAREQGSRQVGGRAPRRRRHCFARRRGPTSFGARSAVLGAEIVRADER